MTTQETPETIIANALWPFCRPWIKCKTNELEVAALVIIAHLDGAGYRICSTLKRQHD